MRSQYHSIGNVGWCVAAAAREFLWWAVFQLFANKSAVSHVRPHYTSSDVPRGFHEKLQADYLFSLPVAFHFATGGSCCANVIGCIANRTKTSNLSGQICSSSVYVALRTDGSCAPPYLTQRKDSFRPVDALADSSFFFWLLFFW